MQYCRRLLVGIDARAILAIGLDESAVLPWTFIGIDALVYILAIGLDESAVLSSTFVWN